MGTEELALTRVDLHRVELMITALYEAVREGEECGCTERALDAVYRRSEWLLAERGDDSRLTEEFLVSEFAAFRATVVRLLATTREHLAQHTDESQSDGSR